MQEVVLIKRKKSLKVIRNTAFIWLKIILVLATLGENLIAADVTLKHLFIKIPEGV